MSAAPAEDRIAAFLTTAGWGDAAHAPLSGDASARRYERLRHGGDAAVLMISPTPGEVLRFARVARWLLERGYSAPRIYAEDAAAGLMLIEDLGDDLVFTLLERDPKREIPLYDAIADFLVDLHRHAPPDFIAPLDGPALADLTRIGPDWYPVLSSEAATEIPGLVAALYDRLNDLPPVLGMRDFHAQNMLWLPGRVGHARLGLLDFQDAVAAHPGYDLVSALQDVRRDVSPETEVREVARYVAARGLDGARFGAIYALLGAQRALRIEAVFARLCLAMGKPHYVDLMPRNRTLMERNLAHPALAPLARAVHAAYPPPNTTLMESLKSRCATRPMP